MIIDCHCHAGKGDGLTGPWDTEARIGPYLRRAGAAGIDKTIIFAPFHSNYHTANAQVAAIARRYPGRFLCFACVHPRRDAGRVRTAVGEAAERWGFRGIKVHRHDAPATREVCEAARDLAIPLLYDVAGAPYLVELLATQYPDVRIIVPHLGSFSDDWRAHAQLIDLLARHPNVYADTSGVRRFDYLVEAVRRAGARKLLFGSDGPWLHPGLELHKIRLLGLPKAEEALILGGNALRLLRRAPAPTAGTRVVNVPA